MARRRNQLRLTALLALTVVGMGSAWAQSPAVGVTPPAEKKKKNSQARNSPPASPSPELENVRKALEALTPEQRQQFRENFNRWMNLSFGDKKVLRDAQEARRKHMSEEIEEAMTQLGLQLQGQKRQQFIKRYTEERKKIEEELRAEADEKRGPEVAELRARLKAEFSASLSGTP
jgi:hypothetical protein